jgi:hypothetical protein
MKILKERTLPGPDDRYYDGYRLAIKARLTKDETYNIYQALADYYHVERCGHEHDCCGCVCHSLPINIVRIGARRVKATINFYRNV